MSTNGQEAARTTLSEKKCIQSFIDFLIAFRYSTTQSEEMSPNNFPPPLNREPTHRNTARDTFFSFVKAINDHDVQSLSRLMSDDHTFIDPVRHTISGRANMIAGWQKYFAWFPDYAIHVEAALDEGETIVAYGSASGSFGKTGSPEDRWQIPAAWRATVGNGRVRLWQVFADTAIPSAIMERNRESRVRIRTNDSHQENAS